MVASLIWGTYYGENPRFPLKCAFKGAIYLGINMDVDMDVDSDLALSGICGTYKGSYRAP